MKKEEYLGSLHNRNQRTPTVISTAAAPIDNLEQKDIFNSLFLSSSSSSKSLGLLPVDNSNTVATSSIPSPLSSLFSSPVDQSSCYSSNYQYQHNSCQDFDLERTPSYVDTANSLFDKLLTLPPSSPYTPVNNTSSAAVYPHMNISLQEATNDLTPSSSYTEYQHNATYPY